MRAGMLAFVAYLVFLAVYAVYKYTAAAPPEFSPDYAQSVAILVALTGIAPFLIAYAVLKAMRPQGLAGAASLGIGLVVGLAAGVAGYAAFWALIIAPSGAPVAMVDVAVRGIGWGLAQGGLAAAANLRPQGGAR